jgi:hypothetical protein
MFLCKLGKERREPRVRARTGKNILLLLVISFNSVNYFVYFTIIFRPMLSKTFERSSLIKLSTVEESGSKIEQTYHE